MPEARSVAAVLLVLAPMLGVLGFYDRALYAIWSAPRDEFLATVAAHRRGWIGLNAGFVAATLGTTIGLALLVGAVDVTAPTRAVLAVSVGAYALGGALWVAVVAIRTRTVPALASQDPGATSTEPATLLLDATIGGLFAAFALLSGLALVGIGGGLAIGGIVAPVGALVALIGALVVLWFLRAGDIIPAVIYVPTLVLGLAILFGGGA